jgi:Tol biopolymer transport system component/predicted Ser/Thr protein kinase
LALLMPLASGTKLGPYETQALLGSGGMGEVYRARDTRLGREVAIKVLAQHLSAQPELKERFDREARAISSLNHPRICTLHDVGHQNGVDFLVMEYLEGESLADRLRRGPLPLKETLKIGMEVCEALDVAHRAGITHRDLKPANIMLTRTGAKLMDFGLAKAAAGPDGGNTNGLLLSSAQTLDGGSPLSPLTTAGTVIGTIQYMSPEQIEGRPADQRSDLFALGAVLYEMVTGKRPFDGRSQISLANAILEKTPEPISVIQPVTPPVFERVVSTCLEKNPDDRFQSARDVRLELSWVTGTAVPLAAQDEVPAANKVPNILAWGVAVIFAAIAGGLFLLAMREKPQPRFTNVTFREGALQAARFSRDGQTIIYSGEWEGQPPQVAVARVGSPESRLLGIPSGTIASVSASDELAVFRGCDQVFLIDCGGTLATVSLAGGAPRDLAEHVAYADWNPDGKQLAIAVVSGEGARLEYPPGHVLCEQKAAWLGHPRFSPDGSKIAFENHPIMGNDEGALELVDLSGKRTVLVPSDVSLEGIAWSPDGKEVWYAGTSNGGWADTIFAVSLTGKKRSVLTMPYLRLHDIAKDGRVLLSHESWRRQLKGFFPGDKVEHPYSWLDDTDPSGISDDGRLISFGEAGETYYLESDYLAYYRATDGSPAVLIGAGTAAISPDGKWLLTTNAMSHKLQLQPIGPGDSRELLTPGLKNFDHQGWSGDGRQVVYEAQTDQNDWNVYKQKIDDGPPALVKAGARNVYPILSHDGELLALRGEQGGISLYREGNPQPTALKGALESEAPVRFTTDGKSLLVTAASGGELLLTFVDRAGGHREPWKRVPVEVQVSGHVFGFEVTPDLKYYTYSSPRYASDLYIVDNLH